MRNESTPVPDPSSPGEFFAGNTVPWEAVNGETCSLWSSFNLKDWSELSNSIMATSEVGEFADTAFAGVQSICYRVRWDPENQ